MIDVKFKDLKVGDVFFEWSERSNKWIEHKKIADSGAVRKGLDVEFEFVPDALCTLEIDNDKL